MIDGLLGFIMLILAIGGWKRGFKREIFHTILFGLFSFISTWLLLSTALANISSPGEAMNQIKQISIIIGISYFLLMVVDRMVIQRYLFPYLPTQPEKVGGAIFGAGKFLTILFIGCFLYQYLNKQANPALPQQLRESYIISELYNYSGLVYQYAAQQGWVTYEKTLWEASQQGGVKRDFNLQQYIPTELIDAIRP